MDSSTMDSPFEWEQYQIEDIISGVLCLLYALLFFGNYVRSKLRVHLVLATSTSLGAVSSFLYAFARPLCEQPGLWLVFLEGQLERLSEIGSFALYLLFVISRLTFFDSMMPGIKKWATPLHVCLALTFISHLIRQFIFDFAIYNGTPLPSDDITTIVYLISMLYFFIVNFSINFIIAKCFIKHALEFSKDKELEKKCRRLRFLVFCSITTTLIGSILFNINFDYNDLLLFHSMNILSNLAITGHFYFEWLYQVLLTSIITTKKFDLPQSYSSSQNQTGASIIRTENYHV